MPTKQIDTKSHNHKNKELEVERAHIFQARAEPELFKSSLDEPEPMDFCHWVGLKPSLNHFFQFFGVKLTLEPEKKARPSFLKIGPGRPGLLTYSMRAYLLGPGLRA